jgi:uncharacterized protein YbjT (DUF2867 family)
MPVVVTGADRPLGRAVTRALAAQGLEVRATVREAPAAVALRALGVPVSVGDLSDPLRFGAVLEGAYTVIHLDDPAGTWEWLLDAAEDTGIRRIVTVLPKDAVRPDPGGYELIVVAGRLDDDSDPLVAALLAADRRQ